MKIGIISDLHGTFDDHLAKFLAEVDEVWCAGDIGSGDGVQRLTAMGKSVVAVYGNIDDHTMRLTYPEWQCFEREGAKVLMTHIGFRGGRPLPSVASRLRGLKPTIFVCGHSHILRIYYDKNYGVLCINPGAAGTIGFHSVRTAVRFDLTNGTPSNLEVWERKRG